MVDTISSTHLILLSKVGVAMIHKYRIVASCLEWCAFLPNHNTDARSVSAFLIFEVSLIPTIHSRNLGAYSVPLSQWADISCISCETLWRPNWETVELPKCFLQHFILKYLPNISLAQNCVKRASVWKSGLKRSPKLQEPRWLALSIL